MTVVLENVMELQLADMIEHVEFAKVELDTDALVDT